MSENSLSPTIKCLIGIKERLVKLEEQIINHLTEHKILSNRLFALLCLILSGIIGILVAVLVK